MSPTALHIAAPLTTRSGVHNSLTEAVRESENHGLDWHGLIGLRDASATATGGQGGALTEFVVEGKTTRARLSEVYAAIDQQVQEIKPDVLISWLPQTDVVLARSAHRWTIPWIAYVRAQPWPSVEEAGKLRRVAWKLPELAALAKADAVWASTEVLRAVLPRRLHARVLAPGLDFPRDGDNPRVRQNVVWAGRYEVDKNPQLFVDIMRSIPEARGVMYGHGPLEDELRLAAPANVTVRGWATAEETRQSAAIVVCTSRREGFGRTAVEAAMVGLPVLLTEGFGAEPYLFTDEKMRALAVHPSSDPTQWSAVIRRLLASPELRRELGGHVKENASILSIDSAVLRMSEALAQVVTSPRRRSRRRMSGLDLGL